jgi:hypothetical protein
VRTRARAGVRTGRAARVTCVKRGPRGRSVLVPGPSGGAVLDAAG